MRSANLVVWGSILLLFISGILAGLYGSTLPQYHNPWAANALFQAAMEGDKCAAGDWYQKMDEMRTSRFPLINLGWGLISIAASIAFLWEFLATNRTEGVPFLRTPSEKRHFFGSGVLLVVAAFLAVWHGIVTDLERQMFPWCADSIAIPMFGLIYSFPIVLGVLLLGGAACTIFFGPIPVSLFNWDPDKPVKSWLVTILFSAIALLLALVTVSGLTAADSIGSGLGIFAIYLVLATRASILSSE